MEHINWEKQQAWQLNIERCRREKRAFMRQTPSEKAEQDVQCYQFAYYRLHDEKPKQDEIDNFVKRAAKWFEKKEANGRMYPDPLIYFPKGEMLDTITYRVLSRDMEEKKYYLTKQPFGSMLPI